MKSKIMIISVSNLIIWYNFVCLSTHPKYFIEFYKYTRTNKLSHLLILFKRCHLIIRRTITTIPSNEPNPNELSIVSVLLHLFIVNTAFESEFSLKQKPSSLTPIFQINMSFEIMKNVHTGKCRKLGNVQED